MMTLIAFGLVSVVVVKGAVVVLAAAHLFRRPPGRRK